MRGLYIIWPDMEYIRKSIESGIDTLLLVYPNPRPDMAQNKDWGTFDEISEIFRDCYLLSDKIKIFLTLTWSQAWYPTLPQEHQFFDGKKHYPLTPCPTSDYHILWLTEYVLDMLPNGIVIDFEEYGAVSRPDMAVRYYGQWERDNHCYCDRCANLSTYEQRMANAKLIKNALSTAASTGHMPYPDPIISGICDWWFNQYTYQSYAMQRKILEHIKRMKKANGSVPFVSCGAWAEHFTAKDYLDYLQKLGESPASDGYWIYPQVRCSRFSYLRDHPPPPPDNLPYMGLIDAPTDPAGDKDFFPNLGRVNRNINKKRDSWGFKLMQWFIDLLW